jgi:shikimate kinase
LNDLLKGVNLYLIGMMGAGKSTIGQLLAQQLGYRFFDTDVLVERVAGQSINDIFAHSGEATFRAYETQVLSELSAYTRLAIATGGGIVLQRENWSHMHHGLIVWLDVPVEHLYSRLKRDATRPLLRDANPLEKLQQLLRERQPLYRQADLHIAIAPKSTPQEVAAQVLAEIPKVLKPTESHPELD